MSKDVAVKQETQLATLESRFTSDAGVGFEEADVNAFAIPFLLILQSGSPQCKKSDGAYIKGAEEGMLYNTVTQEVFPGEEGVTVIPCHYTQRYIEWQPRESGGGFVTIHLPADKPETHKDDKGRDVRSNGNVLVDTRQHYVLLKAKDGSLSPALIAFSSTQQKKSKQWMSKMQGIKIKDANGTFQTAPMMSRQYKITTMAESNDKGSWFGYRIDLNGIVEDAAEYEAAIAFRDAVRGGEAKPKYARDSEEF